MKFLLLLLMLVPLTPALAAPPQYEEEETAQAIRATHKFADCLVGRKPETWAGILAYIPNSRAEHEAMDRMASHASSCLTRMAESSRGEGFQLRFQPAILRGPIAEALLEDDFGGGKGRPGPIFDMAKAAAKPDLTAREKTALAVLGFANCVLDTSHGEVLALLASEPTSPQENAAFDALSPALSSCLEKGAQFEITRPLLRGYLAEAAYREAVQSLSQPLEAAE